MQGYKASSNNGFTHLKCWSLCRSHCKKVVPLLGWPMMKTGFSIGTLEKKICYIFSRGKKTKTVSLVLAMWLTNDSAGCSIEASEKRIFTTKRDVWRRNPSSYFALYKTEDKLRENIHLTRNNRTPEAILRSG